MKLSKIFFTSTLTLAMAVTVATGFSAQAKTAKKAPAKTAAAKKAAVKKHSPLVSVAVFNKWNKKKKAVYIQKIQQALYLFEKSGKYQMAGEPGFLQPWMTLLPEAFADGGQYCMVGGFHRKLVNGKCPTYGRGCTARKNETTAVSDDGFRCGRIWGEICVSRKNNTSGELDISERCKIEYNSMSLKPAIDYAAAKADFDEVYDFCAPDTRQAVYDSRFQGNCDDFLARVDLIRGENGEQVASGDAVTTGTGQPAGAGDPEGAIVPLKIADEDIVDVAAASGDPLPIPATRQVAVGDDDDDDDNNDGQATAPASTNASDCMNKYKTLGELACVACGMEESDVLKADLQRQGKDLKKWLSLLGVMAQSYNARGEPFNLADSDAKKQYQQTVMTMIASFGYCTDDEFKTVDFDNAYSSIAVWMQANPLPLYGAYDANSPATQLFAKTYGLSDPANPSRPMNFATGLFSGMKSKFSMDNVPGNQFRFKQALIKMMNKGRANEQIPGFKGCGEGILRRMNEPKLFQMCGLRGAQLEGPLYNYYNKDVVTNQCTVKKRASGGFTCEEGAAHNYIKEVKEGELFKNEKMYNSMANSCDLANVTYKKMTCPTRCLDIQPWGDKFNYQCEGKPEPPPEGCKSNCEPTPPCTVNCGGDEKPEVVTERPTEKTEDTNTRPPENPENSNQR